MNWQKSNPPSRGVYWVQTRDGLAHITVRYQSAYWSGYKWSVYPGEVVYFWMFIEQAPEPEDCLYYDELGRLDVVAAQERGVELHTNIAEKE